MKKSNLLLLILIAVIFTILSSYIDNKILHYVFKPLSTLLVILLTVLYAKKPLKAYKNRILIGLVFCLIGDVFLMFDAYFVFGLGSFLIGHLFFIYAFSSINGFSTKIKTLIPLVAIACFILFYLKEDLGDLLIPVILYIITIVLMAWQAINLYMWKKEYGYLLITIGALLFLVSDSVLSYKLFIADFSLAQFIIYSTYFLAITLISLSTIYINEKTNI